MAMVMIRQIIPLKKAIIGRKFVRKATAKAIPPYTGFLIANWAKNHP
jgi:hypothetical protein